MGTPLKIAFFLWRTAQEIFPRLTNLIRRRWNYVNWCCTCKNERESVTRLNIHYEVNKDLLGQSLALFDISLVLQKKVAGFFCLGVMVNWGSIEGKGVCLHCTLGYFVCSFPEMVRLLLIILLVS